MLRTELGDDAFNALLRDFYKKYEGKNASLNEFEKMAMTKVPPPVKGQPPVNLISFFSQWLNSTGVPEFKMEYIVYRTQKGFKVVGKIHQDLDTFRMPVEIRVDTEGNPETKTILVTGTTQPFQIDTFGRPKPNGIIIDPNNNLLKSSPRLRVHAPIARGEGYAELANITKQFRNIKKRWTLSRAIRWRISGWARRCSTRRIIRPRRMRFARRWAATRIRSGQKFGATFTSERFTICWASASAP